MKAMIQEFWETINQLCLALCVLICYSMKNTKKKNNLFVVLIIPRITQLLWKGHFKFAILASLSFLLQLQYKLYSISYVHLCFIYGKCNEFVFFYGLQIVKYNRIVEHVTGTTNANDLFKFHFAVARISHLSVGQAETKMPVFWCLVLRFDYTNQSLNVRLMDLLTIWTSRSTWASACAA